MTARWMKSVIGFVFKLRAGGAAGQSQPPVESNRARSCPHHDATPTRRLIKRWAVGVKNVLRNDLPKKTLPTVASKRLISQQLMMRIRFLAVFIGWLPAMLFAAGEVYRPVAVTPPPPARELRGAWISAVATNADWPSKPGLNVAAQKEELIALLNRAVQLKLNAVFIQMRPSCDALYASPFEPWSEYLTGTMGRAPQPFYDPLAFAIEEAHKR